LQTQRNSKAETYLNFREQNNFDSTNRSDMANDEIKQILITGGAGFIGSHTAEALVGKGYGVRILDLLDSQIHGELASFPAYLNTNIECIRGDIRNPLDVAAALEDIDAIYHFASLTGVGQSMYDIRNYVDTNCTGTATLLESIIKHAKDLKKIVLASSRAVYGEGTYNCPNCGLVYPPPRIKSDLERGEFEVHCPICTRVVQPVATHEDRPLQPISIYGWTKKQQEEQFSYLAHTFRIPVVILRYQNVYGSRQSLKNPYTGIVSIFYSRLRSGGTISLYERGKPIRDFIHVFDVVTANLLALERNLEIEAVINIGTGKTVSVVEVAATLAEVGKIRPRFEDHGEFRVGDIYSCYSDTRRANSLLGFTPQLDLESGLREFVTWAADQQAVDSYEKTVDELQARGLYGRADRPS
jgi:dTDP-L-rhamnose 4-epimerase